MRSPPEFHARICVTFLDNALNYVEGPTYHHAQHSLSIEIKIPSSLLFLVMPILAPLCIFILVLLPSILQLVGSPLVERRRLWRMP